MVLSRKAGVPLRAVAVVSAVLLGAAGLLSAVSLVLVTTWLHRAAVEMFAALESIRAAEELRTSLLAYNREILLSEMVALDGRPDDAERAVGAVEEAAADIRLWSDRIDGNAAAPEEVAVVRRVHREIEAYLQIRDGLAMERAAPLDRYRRAAEPLATVLASLESLIDYNHAEALLLQERISLEDSRANRLGIASGLMLVILISGLLSVGWLYAYVPLVRLSHTIARFGHGDLEARARAEGPTELREMSELFNEMAGKIAKSREVQLGFLAAVAHDLRNPLGAMKASVHLLPAVVQAGGTQCEQVLVILGRQIDLIDRMVGDLLDTAGIEAGRLHLRLELCDLRNIVGQSVSLYQATGPGQRLALQLPGDSVPCRCDPLRVGQVLNNFISNALKYSPAESDVHVALRGDETGAIVEVSDRGTGIPPEELPHIFEPFRRTSATRDSIPGVGLGLSVARQIARAHGGEIEVESEPGVGSAFRLRLPGAQADAES